MQEEFGFIEKLFSWLNEHAAWFVPLAGAVAMLMIRVHRYFTGLNRVAEEVAKLTDEDDGVMMKKDVLATIRPVLDHIENSNAKLDRIESSTNERLNRIETLMMQKSGDD